MKTREQEFSESLNDQRSIWLNGKQVRVLEEEAFRGAIQTVCNLFRMMDDPTTQESVAYVSPTTGEWVHQSFHIPQSIVDLQKRRVAFEQWSEATDGMMSRLSDYARSRLTGWYCARNQFSMYDSAFSEKIARYYEQARDENRFITVVQRDVQINRANQYDPQLLRESGLLHITRKTQDGIYLNGAKMIATAAPYTHDFLIYPVVRLNESQKSVANMLIVPADSAGLHIVCRESFAKSNQEQPDFPLSSQYDEMDALLIFDDVFIPWEYVFIHENPEAIWVIKENPHSICLGYHQAIIRLKTKLEFITGLACKIATTIGATQFLHVQEKLGELISQVETIHACIIASEAEGAMTEEGIFLPRATAIDTAKNLGTTFYPRAVEILQLIAAGGVIQIPSSVQDFQSPISDLMNQYFRGADVDAEKRTKLFKLAWDVIGTPFASRSELYERFYSGDPIRNRAGQYLSYDKDKLTNMIDKYL
ncbi:4-hydroxyphenylacetate 3-monooxygenase [Croceifilum oryzae]|uniref:4-hydroxyphenylacetate 3-monooxygenase n=1 Tax=Croceifilum oryzae TaxID=1553429 RepID=A0AAJ1TBV3_9BACL|nr:4-hydroxyphenylacetate 3-hydroxylase N-terminal domain-containing protein [Croceifilum oryzae]MDQ0415985.1 4-hydroxyphenylacetate 3-monooxygenase [Croceifilum oryzae]